MKNCILLNNYFEKIKKYGRNCSFGSILSKLIINQYFQKSEAVERLHISAPEAFSKFQGKQLDVRTVDFSDHIGRKPARGYNVGLVLHVIFFIIMFMLQESYC